MSNISNLHDSLYVASYVIAGGINVRREVVSGKIDRLMRFSDHAFEEFCTIIRKAGDEHKNVTRGNSIVNLSGYNLVEIGCLRCTKIKFSICLNAFSNITLSDFRHSIVHENTGGLRSTFSRMYR